MGDTEDKSLAREVTIDGQPYFYIPIEVAIKYSDKILSGFYVPLSETKRVRIEYGDDDVYGKLATYKAKGLENILFAEEDYFSFLKAIKRGLTGFFMKSDELAGKPLSIPQTIFLVNKAFIYIGLDAEIASIGEEITKKVLNDIKTVSSVNPVLKAFQKENQDEFLRNMLIGYVSIALIDALNWTTPQIKLKVAQASLFCDITLTEQDFLHMILVNGEQKRYNRRVLNHPREAAQLLSRTHNAVSREVVRAIEQHHEMPDGSGYPAGIKGLSIDQLSALTIVARKFINKLVDSNFAYDDRKKFIDDLLEDFNYPNFSQPCKALYKVMGLEDAES